MNQSKSLKISTRRKPKITAIPEIDLDQILPLSLAKLCVEMVFFYFWILSLLVSLVIPPSSADDFQPVTTKLFSAPVSGPSVATTLHVSSTYPGSRLSSSQILATTSLTPPHYVYVISGLGRDFTLNDTSSISCSPVSNMENKTTITYPADVFRFDRGSNDWTHVSDEGAMTRTAHFASFAHLTNRTSSASSVFYSESTPSLAPEMGLMPRGRAGGLLWWIVPDSMAGLFGGFVAGQPRADLWTIDVVTGTFLRNSTDSMGEGAIFDGSGTWPAARAFATGFVEDGMMYMFGGAGVQGRGFGDLWNWTARSGEGQWARMFPSDDIVCPNRNVSGEGEFLRPGAREGATGWIVRNESIRNPAADNSTLLFVFGGRNPCGAYRRAMSDLWVFYVDENAWKLLVDNKWMPGSDDSGRVRGAYDYDAGTEGVVRARRGALGFVLGSSFPETDLPYRYLGLFGGVGNSGPGDLFDDLWVLDMQRLAWMLVRPNGVAEGDDAVSGIVGGRTGVAGAQVSMSSVILFGGLGLGTARMTMYNDVWELSLDATCGGGSPLHVWEEGVCSGRGFCVGNNKCNCVDAEYEGSDCDELKRKCDGVRYDLEDDVCSGGRGNCTFSGACDCLKPYYGFFCAEAITSAGVFSGKDANGTLVALGFRVAWRVDVVHLPDVLFPNMTVTTDCAALIEGAATILGSSPTCKWFATSAAAKASGLTDFLEVWFGSNTLLNETDSEITLIPQAATNDTSARAVLTLTNWPGDPEPDPPNYTVYVIVGVAVTLSLIVLLVCLILICSWLTALCCTKGKTAVEDAERMKHLQLLALQHEKEYAHADGLDVRAKELFNVDYHEIEIIAVVSDTSPSATVYKAKYKAMDVCFKCYRVADMDSQEQMDEFQRELYALKDMRNPNLVKIVGGVYEKPKIGVVTEWCDCGNLESFIKDPPHGRPLTLNAKLRILGEVSSGMSYLHARDIIHRDLASENVLLTDNLVVRIMSLGLSRVVEGAASAYLTKQAGTSKYMAPEVTLSSKYSSKCDVFSYGIMMYEVLTEDFDPYKTAYGSVQENLELKVALNADYRPHIEKFPQYAQVPCLRWYVDLMDRCWSVDTDDRPAFGEILRIVRGNSLATTKAYDGEASEIKKPRRKKRKPKASAALRLEVAVASEGSDSSSSSSSSDD